MREDNIEATFNEIINEYERRINRLNLNIKRAYDLDQIVKMSTNIEAYREFIKDLRQLEQELIIKVC